MKKILWLASWYPNKISPLNGDFIQRHAEAVSLHEPIHVIFVVKDEHKKVTGQVAVEYFERNNLSETIAYYKPIKTGVRSLDRLISVITYFNILRKLVGIFIKEFGIPRLVHVHVAMWVGIMAWWLKRRGIPYIVTEHWTGYQKNALENIDNKGWLFKRVSISVLKNADLILPVSRQLGETIHNHLYPVTFFPASNVVNTLYFNSPGYSGNIFRFIHVSAMGPQKNAEGLLSAFSKLLLTHSNCRLIMAGPAPGKLIEKANHLKLQGDVDWLGAITYNEVAKAMWGSSAFVLFSNYENQPCVILEALCSGLPVISTNVGGIPEVINADNGILISPGNELQLLQAMIQVMETYKAYNKIQISETAKNKFSYDVIGKMMADLYRAYDSP